MRDRNKDKGVKVCPTVELNEIHFLEPLEEDKDSSDESLNLSDGEGT